MLFMCDTFHFTSQLTQRHHGVIIAPHPRVSLLTMHMYHYISYLRHVIAKYPACEGAEQTFHMKTYDDINHDFDSVQNIHM